MQYTSFPISQDIGQSENLIWWVNKYNMRNIFIEQSYTKSGGDTIPRLFSKKSKLRCWITGLKFYEVYFYCVIFWGDHYISNCRPLFFPSYKNSSKKQKEIWNYSPYLTLCMAFEKKYFSCCISLTDQISLSDCL